MSPFEFASLVESVVDFTQYINKLAFLNYLELSMPAKKTQ